MEDEQDAVANLRAQTDASLGTERSSSDSAMERASVGAQRVLDDLIKQDRVVADDLLSQFREDADSALELRRRSFPASINTTVERLAADESKRAEREVSDTLLDLERRQTDALVQKERQAHENAGLRLEADRLTTDNQLATERNGAKAGAADSDPGLTLAEASVLGMVTHDLRSPLCIIAMNAQILTDAATESSTREAAREVTRAAARMGRLLADLFDVVRVESGAFRIVQQPCDVGALVNEVFQSYRTLFAGRGLHFTVQVPAAPLFAPVDHDRIVQVLSNLLGNAMRFTPPEGTISLCVEARGDDVEVSLTDSGPGIHPGALPHLFKRFYQVNSESRRGLGLGLYICDQIVQAHGGRISVDTVLGKGATFRFTIPRAGRGERPKTMVGAADRIAPGNE